MNRDPGSFVVRLSYVWQEFMRQINPNGFQSLCHSMYDDYFVVIKIFDFDFDFGNSPITDELTTQRQVTRSFDVFCA